MVGVAACGTVDSIKALWETRIRKGQEEEKEEARRRKTKGGVAGRSEKALSIGHSWSDNFKQKTKMRMKSCYHQCEVQ